jgi:hypothetical protein
MESRELEVFFFDQTSKRLKLKSVFGSDPNQSSANDFSVQLVRTAASVGTICE